MANQLYNIARKKFALGDINWEDGGMMLCLIKQNGYTLDVAGHTNISDVPTSARDYGPGTAGARQYLNGAAIPVGSVGYVVNDNGAMDAGDVTFDTIGASGDITKIVALVMYRASDGLLIMYLDSATGLPIDPNGGDIICTWDNGDNKIARL
jgi:hypothetical protein